MALARAELGKHVTEVRMEPDLTERHYVAKGQWNLLGGYPKTDVRVGFIAGACSVPNALIVPFSFELVHHAVAGFGPATFGL